MRRLQVRQLWLLVPFWVVALRAGGEIEDNSFLWHVRAGLDQLAGGEVIRTDPYSFTRAGEPWRTQSWLIELGYGRVETWFPGLGWTPLFTVAVMGAALAIILVVVRSGSTLTGTVVVAVLLGWVAQPYVVPRPSVAGYLLLAVLVATLAARRPPLWVLPGLFWVWAAVHGTFVIGLGLLVLESIRRRSRRHLLAFGLSAVGASLTAHGIGVWEIVWRFFANRSGLRLIEEWLPPDFTSLALAPAIVLLGILMVGLGKGRIDTRALWIILPIIFLGLTANRNVFPAFLLLAPWLGAGAAVLAAGPADRRASPVAAWCLLGVLVVGSVWVVSRPVSLSEELFPSSEAITASGPGPLFHNMSSAGAILYLEGAERPVVIDDRVELYGYDNIADWQRVSAGIGWREWFEDLGIKQALVARASRLVEDLVETGWQSCYNDELFILLAEECERAQ